MIDQFATARPYAKAAFDVATVNQSQAVWQVILSQLAHLVENQRIHDWLKNPEIDFNLEANIVSAIVQDIVDLADIQLTVEHKNFIMLLVHERRLTSAPAIAHLYDEYVLQASGKQKARVSSAMVLDQAEQERLIQALAKRLQSEVEIEFEIDPSLIGGMVIRYGSWVWDGSIKHKLSKLKQSFETNL